MSVMPTTHKAVVMSFTSTSGPTKVSPSVDPGNVWGNHKSVMIRAVGANVTVYFADPATGMPSITVPKGGSLSIDYSNEDLWVDTPGTAEILAIG